MFSKFLELKANLSLRCWTLPISGLFWQPPAPPRPKNKFWTSSQHSNQNMFCSKQCLAMGLRPTCYSNQPSPGTWLSMPILSLGHFDRIVMLSEDSFITCVTSNRLVNADIMNQVTLYNLRSILQICTDWRNWQVYGRGRRVFHTRAFGSSRKQVSQSEY